MILGLTTFISTQTQAHHDFKMCFLKPSGNQS